MSRAEKKLRSANGTKRSFKMEIRLVAEPKQKKRFESQLSKHDRTLAALSNDLKALKSNANRDQLFAGGGGKGMEYDEEDAQKTGDQMLNDAGRIQDKTQDSLGQTKAMIAASKEVGMSTVEELQNQRAQIENIDSELDRMEDNLSRADKLLKAFGKRMATDKFIQCFACVNVLLLGGVVAYVVFGKDDDDEGEAAPENPFRF
jgi:SNARE protein